MLLSNDIDSTDYKLMKMECDRKILGLKAGLKTLRKNNTEQLDNAEIIDRALLRLNMLFKLNRKAEIHKKRLTIDSPPGKMEDFRKSCTNRSNKLGGVFVLPN
ncbi:hypothetical protein SAMN05192573_107173 [Mucilaginibacter gossypii]|uniref:Uncharacterized protein n=1 Tax=Mucilaginibacter gossypii TaxID=551996 RepID=A0A1G8AEM8_9SPHI|nr:hypothetical protein SAMN05192573_107173 [Mucilaginibacter gossypii]